MVLNRVFTANNEISYNKWHNEVEEAIEPFTIEQKSLLRAMDGPACYALNIFQNIIIENGEFSSTKYCPRDWPISCDLDTESELLAHFCLDISYEIELSYSDFYLEPDWVHMEPPLPESSEFLEDIIK